MLAEGQRRHIECAKTCSAASSANVTSAVKACSAPSCSAASSANVTASAKACNAPSGVNVAVRRQAEFLRSSASCVSACQAGARPYRAFDRDFLPHPVLFGVSIRYSLLSH